MKNYGLDYKNGVFTVKQRETGKDWCNLLWNEIGYQTEITHTGASSSLFVDASSARITLNERKSGVVYFRDDENGRYWNAGGYPTAERVSRYRCEHAMNDSRISSEKGGVKTEVGYAVSERHPYEVWRVTVQNKSKRARKISVFAGTVFQMEGYAQPFYYNAFTTSETKYFAECNAVVCLSQNPYAKFKNKHGFFMASEPPFAYEGYADGFTGVAGGFAKPLVLENRQDLSCRLATVRSRCGFLQHKLTLLPDETAVLYYFCGFCESEDALLRDCGQMKQEGAQLFENARERGNARFGNLRTQSPDGRVNTLMNFWAEKQVRYCAIGKKAVRDNAQLAAGILNFDVAFSKRVIEECLVHQYRDGHAVLLWYPVEDTKLYSDPAFWLVYAVCEYIKETGDFAFLAERYAYLDGGEGSVSEHLNAAAKWYADAKNVGEHGLPKIYYADWNDALNIPDENAESVFMGECVCLMMKELCALFAETGDGEASAFAAEQYKRFAAAVNACAWNGDYYVRALSKFGAVGDKSSPYGKFYINAQSFAILADIVPADRLAKLLASVDANVTDEGIRLCVPPYPHYDERVGRMSGMLPGVYENGGIYNHAGCFKIMADCALGRGEQAYKSLCSVMPDGDFNPSEKTTVEPYVFVNCYLKHPSVDMICGPSWQTGTSAWGLRCYYEGILGIRRTYRGILLSPCLPASWKKVTAERTFRGAKLKFVFENAGRGKAEIYVDGNKTQSNLLAPFDDGKTHTITYIY